jgi:hypothetical protein
MRVHTTCLREVFEILSRSMYLRHNARFLLFCKNILSQAWLIQDLLGLAAVPGIPHDQVLSELV